MDEGVGLDLAVDGDADLDPLGRLLGLGVDTGPFGLVMIVAVRDCGAVRLLRCGLFAARRSLPVEEDFVFALPAATISLPALLEVHGLAVVGPDHLPFCDAEVALDGRDLLTVTEDAVDDLVPRERGRGEAGDQDDAEDCDLQDVGEHFFCPFMAKLNRSSS